MSHMIYFEVAGQGYAINSEELAGVANSCPFVSYPGLPEKVCGIVLWSGKIFPVVEALGARQSSDLARSTFIFSNSFSNQMFQEVALAVSSQVRVFFAASIESVQDPNFPWIVAKVRDKNGLEAIQISLSALVSAATADGSHDAIAKETLLAS